MPALRILRPSSRLTLALCVLALAGCNLFDQDLYLNADAAVAGLALSDTCGASAPMVSANMSYVVDTTRMEDDLDSALAGCTGQPLPGNDGFFGVEMVAGEKWHFHVRNGSGAGVNPAIYILNNVCDDRGCQPGDAIDACIEDRDEHLSFVADRTGTFYVGLDARTAGGGVFSVEVWKPECGNGTLEHSEGCDDPLDATCDADCRRVLTTGAQEIEPNDDFTASNVTQLGAGSFEVRGTVVDLCDLDMFRVEVPAGGTLTATLLDRNGAVCVDPVVPLTLELLDDSGVQAVGTGTTGGPGGACPAISGQPFATGLAAGVYFLRVTTSATSALFNYRLQITISE
ncbi:MAG: hypothetical protein R3B40_24215 [Polyangiales bacterium]|nr:hypothetical protein [Sandaracinaceae bacterium]